jgi:hypothetical protein
MRADEIGEGGELDANQVLDFDAPPFDGCKRLDALGK